MAREQVLWPGWPAVVHSARTAVAALASVFAAGLSRLSESPGRYYHSDDHPVIARCDTLTARDSETIEFRRRGRIPEAAWHFPWEYGARIWRSLRPRFQRLRARCPLRCCDAHRRPPQSETRDREIPVFSRAARSFSGRSG